MTTRITTGTCDTCNVKKFPVVVTPELRGERRGCAKCEAEKFESQARKDIDAWLSGEDFPQLALQIQSIKEYDLNMKSKRHHVSKLDRLNELLDRFEECKDVLTELARLETQAGGDPELFHELAQSLDSLVLDTEEELDRSLTVTSDPSSAQSDASVN